jgi:anaerobic selenocysteine-containing dehydrogenase
VPAEITDEVMPGVVSLPHGFGHARAGVRLGVAARMPGASLNDLTDEERLDDLTGNAALNGIAVSIRALDSRAERDSQTAHLLTT